MHRQWHSVAGSSEIDAAGIETAKPSPISATFPLDILILARDEEGVILSTLAAVQKQMGAHDRLHVVADHCSDSTAEIARSVGADVYHRRRGRLGKGPAIQWWLEQTHPTSQPGVLILDADSLPGPSLIDDIRTKLISGTQVVQAHVRPLVRNPNPIALFAAFSEEKEQAVWDQTWAQFGFSVRLRGTGMGFLRKTLEAVVGALRTTIEDAELSLLLANQGVRIERMASAYVLDPKPIDSFGAAQQRARWLQGQAQLMRLHPRTIAQLLLKKPRSWPLVATVLVKPRSLLIPLAGAAALASLWGWLAGILPLCAGLLFLIPILLEIATVIAGLIVIPSSSPAVRTLLEWPRYAFMWLDSLRLSLRTRNAWLRVRNTGVQRPAREPRSAES